jgi:EAL domain-containing protein (putative c-di-GMP-specific phosphodiesterase class I)
MRETSASMGISDLRFLIVEDHDFQRMTLAALLSGLGAKEVLQAAHGRAALDMVDRPGGDIDVIVSDLDMPDMDGMEFIRHIGESGIAASVILASALDRQLVSSVEMMTRAYGVRLLGAIEKPITSTALEALLAHYSRSETPRPDARVQPRLNEILQGLANHEFEPFFQPVIDLRTGEVRAAEALARWRRTNDVQSPATFLKQLEDGERVDDLTWEILDRAAKCCRAWHDRGFSVPVCVNLSLEALSDVTMGERIAFATASHGLKPSDVVLEVTESALASNLGAALETLSRLRLRGFGLAIDDFGTGYSSLQQLSRIPFTELKIDQSFVHGAAGNDSRRVILKSSLEMARDLGIVAVAEGVESQADWDLLVDSGCDLAQGYFVARPMAYGAFVDWMGARPSRA